MSSLMLVSQQSYLLDSNAQRLEDMISSAAEETTPHHPASMVVGTSDKDDNMKLVFSSNPFLPERSPTSTEKRDIFRRLPDGSSPVVDEQYIGNVNAFKTYGNIPEELNIQESFQNQDRDINIVSVPCMPVSELGCNVSYSQECTEDTDGTCLYVEGKHWSKGRRIGGGASGNCYIATDNKTKSEMVVKQVSIKFSKVEDIYSEINIMNSIRHPNIVNFIGATNNHCYSNIFMEWMKGGSLERKLHRNGPLSEDVMWKYSKQIICGLKYLHGRGIAHRDLKGANILLDSNCQTLRIADFGAAARITELSKFHKTVGTPPFMAPEVVHASVTKGYCLKCDVWSLGCVVIEMGTAKPPWVADSHSYSRWEILYKIGSSSIPPPIPRFHVTGLRDLVIQCLQLNPNNRPSSSELP